MADPDTYQARVVSRPTYALQIIGSRLGTMLAGNAVTFVFEASKTLDGTPFDPTILRVRILRPDKAAGQETVYVVTFVLGDPVITLDAVLIAFDRTADVAAGSFTAEILPPIELTSIGTWRVSFEGQNAAGKIVVFGEGTVRVQPGQVRLVA